MTASRRRFYRAIERSRTMDRIDHEIAPAETALPEIVRRLDGEHLP